jgi:hypothetical protein
MSEKLLASKTLQKAGLTVLYYLLIGLGLSQMVGYTSHHNLLRGTGAFSGAAPLPLAFGHYQGIEFGQRRAKCR